MEAVIVERIWDEDGPLEVQVIEPQYLHKNIKGLQSHKNYTNKGTRKH